MVTDVVALTLATTAWLIAVAATGTRRSLGALFMCVVVLVVVVVDAQTGPTGASVHPERGLNGLITALVFGACGVLLTPSAA